MKDSTLKPKIFLNADYGYEDKLPPPIKLDLKFHQRNISEPSPKNAFYPKIKLVEPKSPLMNDIGGDSSLESDHATPENNVLLPLSIVSHARLSFATYLGASKDGSHAFLKSPMHSQTTRHRPSEKFDKLSINIAEPPSQRPSHTKFALFSQGSASDRQEKSKDSTETQSAMPQIKSARAVVRKPHQTKTKSGFRTIERFATEGFEDNAYEKTPEIVKLGKVYKDKMSALNLAEIRKSFGDSSESRKNSANSQRSEAGSPVDSPFFRTRQFSEVGFIKNESLFKKLAGETFRDSSMGAPNEDIELMRDRPNYVNLQKAGFTYCYIAVMGKNSPLTISIQGVREIKKIKVFASMAIKKPTKLNCNYEFETRNFKLFEKDKNSTKFLNAYFYFAIFSDETGTVTVKADFEHPREISSNTMRNFNPARVIKKKKTMLSEIPKSILEGNNIYAEIEQIKKERKEKLMQLSQGIDRVELNKNTDQYMPTSTTQKREILKQKSEDLLKTVQSRKLALEHEKLEKRKTNLMRHEIQKVAKELALAEKKKEKETQFCLGLWVLNIFFCNLGASMKKLIHDHKISFARQIRMTSLLTQFARKMQRNLQRRADTVENRLMLDFRLAIQFQALMIQKARKPEIERIVISFLQENMNIQFLKNKFLNSFQAIRKAQGSFKDYMNRKEGFKTCMLILWEKNYQKVCEEMLISPDFASNDMKPVLKRLQTKDMSANDAAKKKFIKLWFQKCLERYKKNFDVHNSEVFKLDSEEKQKWMQQYAFQPANKKEDEALSVRNLRRVSRVTLMEEFQKNRMINMDYSSKNMTVEDKLIPPKLFFLPTQEELEELMKQVLIM